MNNADPKMPTQVPASTTRRWLGRAGRIVLAAVLRRALKRLLELLF